MSDSRFPYQSILSVDWFEMSGCVEWKASGVFPKLRALQDQAKLQCKPDVFREMDEELLVYERGMGSGRASYKDYRLEWRGATIGVSPREEATRQLSNFYLKIPGDTCLRFGFAEVYETVVGWLEEWEGTLVDDWLGRLDLCLDVVGLDLQSAIFPACAAGQYLSTMKKNSLERDGDRTTGFIFGRRPGARFLIYDKLAEVEKKADGLYTAAMLEQRWGGVLPSAAARIEYQLPREFLQQFDGLNTTANVIARLPDIFERLLQTECRPFFMLTDTIPNREARHQDRVGVHPEWCSIIEAIRSHLSKPSRRLERKEQQLIDTRRACANTIGYLTSVAAQCGMMVEGKNDLVDVLRHVLDQNVVSDESIRLKFEDKARRYGTLNELTKFRFGGHAAA